MPDGAERSQKWASLLYGPKVLGLHDLQFELNTDDIRSIRAYRVQSMGHVNSAEAQAFFAAPNLNIKSPAAPNPGILLFLEVLSKQRSLQKK